MDIQSGDISKLVFKRVTRKDSGNVSIDTKSLEILMEIDGKANLGAIAQKAGMDAATIRAVISGLMKQNLIEPSSNGVKMLGNDFQEVLEAELALAVGPIAEVLVEDAYGDLGLTPGKVPLAKAAGLIELLSRDIQREEKKSAFIKTMIGVVKQYQ
jgi:predicted transcriptional regulator